MATINSSIKAEKAKVVITNGTTFAETCTCSDSLQSFTVDRDEENNKFFGFGICQSMKLELIDLERRLNLEKGFSIRTYMSTPTIADGAFVISFPYFYIEDITRDEEFNSLSVVAYDKLYKASAHTVSELALTVPYTILDVANACASLLGITQLSIQGMSNTDVFNTSYEQGANFGGNETIRQVLNAIAEATQTIYFIDSGNNLVFKRLRMSGTVTIPKENYFTLKSGEIRTIGAICHATELGDNVIAGDENGIIQYVRENPFWTNRDDIGALVEAAMAAVEGLTIQEFICDDWSYTQQAILGTRIGFEAEDGSYIYSYLLNDTIHFDGTISEATQWKFEPNDNETATNPTSLGEQLSQTTARVDKAARTIELKAQEIDSYSSRISNLEVTTEGIYGSVERITKATETNAEAIDGVSEEVAGVKTEVSNFKLEADKALLEFKTTIETDGVTKVETATGFKFNEEGLTVSKSDSEMETQITEDGMTISRGGEKTLVANNEGVQAEDLHATTWLIIGNNSRIEDYGSNRTGCFWIGG